MKEDKNTLNQEVEELEVDLKEYVRRIVAARKLLLKVAGI